MKSIVLTELAKMKRCQILLVGVVALAFCPVLQYGTHLIASPEEPYDMVRLFENVIWGNTQMFLPISYVMIGGFLIHRESAEDTLKNVLTVPISFRRLIVGKLLAASLLSVCFGLYSCALTLLMGLSVGLQVGSAAALMACMVQNTAICLITYVVTTPLIVLFGCIPGAYLGGSIAAFFCGYSILFFKGGVLRSVYPFLAAFTLVGFDTAEYNGAREPGSAALAMLAIGVVLLAAALLVAAAKPPERAKREKRARGTGRR